MALPWAVGDPVTADGLNDMTNADTAPVAKGVIARGRRTTSTSTITTTETGVIRLDSIPVYAGRGYMLMTNNVNIDTSVANDIATATLRISTSGSATTASTFVNALRTTIDDATNSNILNQVGFYYPASDATLSVLLSLVRTAGTGNIIMFSSGAQFTDLLVVDLGIVPADTAVII